ncbi:MAG: DUF4351 domain-containing protein [Scytonematopsis contorta HA4267-MV1]|jgi:hypothetical protein|nr:DUF4351 domain-containing protein [Scytonematopsis contorta HA4267-MV1]
MTRFIHDQFAKEYLERLLQRYGEFKSSEKVPSEVREIDVLFTPFPGKETNLQTLGLLGRCASSPSIFEPFRNAASEEEICNCVLKSLSVRGALQREARRNETRISESALPKLWILTPSASKRKLSDFGAVESADWVPGVYLMAKSLRTVIVVIHQLPRIPETLWLRVLGRGKVQKQAIDELEALPLRHPYAKATLELLYALQQSLIVADNPPKDDTELIMRLAPLFQQERERAKQEGILKGRQQERQEAQQREQFLVIRREQLLIIRLLNRRLGEIDSSLIERVRGLSIEKLEDLGEALLDFSTLADLEAWLGQQEV